MLNPSPLEEALSALREVVKLAERNVCSHEDTHRGGTLWEICDMCGAKWADDEGGKPEYTEPEGLTRAYEILKRHGVNCAVKKRPL